MRLLTALIALLAAPAFAQIQYIGSTSLASATSRTPDDPDGAQEGDLLLGVCSTVNAVDGTWSVPAGFTKITEVLNTEGTDRDVVLAYAIRGESAGDYTFSYSGSEGQAMRCIMAAFSDVDTSNPWDVPYSGEDHHVDYDNGPNEPAQPITTVTDGAWVLLVQVRAGDVSDATAAPSGYTEIVNYRGQNPEISIVAKEVSTAGTETPGEWGHTGAPFADAANFTLAIRDAAD